LRKEVDLVVHGGDLLYRSRVPDGLIERAMAPLLEVAEAGIPVYLVPGNHERSRIPNLIWSSHPQLHIFDRPRTFVCDSDEGPVALAGFPFVRKARSRFRDLLIQTGYAESASVRAFLCTHLAFEGARVGVSDYTFRRGDDVVRGKDIPEAITAVFSGHIHRAQVLTEDLSGRPLGAPVIYPGSVERTSFVEREETKGYFVVYVGRDGTVEPAFHELETRPMFVVEVDTREIPRDSLPATIESRLSRLPPDAVVQIRFSTPPSRFDLAQLTAARLRSIAPETMNVSVAGRVWRHRSG
jgi:DNA repair exonuclease SbcCD nuclease subunit